MSKIYKIIFAISFILAFMVGIIVGYGFMKNTTILGKEELQEYIDFSQAYGIDGPSAGVTMTILLCSLLEGKPIKQDIAVTGEINITSTDIIEITAVGGIHEKIKAAEGWKFEKVIIPQKNFQLSINPSEYNIKIIGGKTLSDYLKEILVNEENL